MTRRARLLPALLTSLTLVLGGLAGLAGPASADPQNGEPSGSDCEWYGSTMWRQSQKVSYEDGGWQKDTNTSDGWSTASSSGCTGVAKFHHRMDANVGGSCFLGMGDGQAAGTYTADWTGDVVNGHPLFSVAFTTGVAADFTQGWGSCDPADFTIRPNWFDISSTANCAVDVPESATATIQAVVTTCSRHDATESSTVDETWTIRMRRRNCDPTVDTDGDNLADCTEYALATDPANPDTDGDGLTDGEEVLTHKTNPLLPDSDRDALTDGEEIFTYGTNPLLPDTDGDGLPDGVEVNSTHTDPNVADSDGDTVRDGDDRCPSVPGSPEFRGCKEKPPSCADATAAERFTTQLDVATRLNVAFANDPHIGDLHLQFAWCMTPGGPEIMVRPDVNTDPYAYWDSTDNWILLGALESFGGITINQPTPEVTHSLRGATVTSTLNANLDAVALVSTLLPVGKLFKPMKAVLGRYADELNPLAKKLKAADAKVAAKTASLTEATTLLRDARQRLFRVQADIIETRDALKAATSSARRKELEEQLARLKTREAAQMDLVRLYRQDVEVADYELRKALETEAAVARRVDAVLTQVREALAAANNFVRRIHKALDGWVAGLHPDWAQEVAREMVKLLVGQVETAVTRLEEKVKGLTSEKLVEIMQSQSATDALLSYLKGFYEKTLGRIEKIAVPVWDGHFFVSLDNNGEATVSDFSESRFIFTVESEPTLTLKE